MGTFVTSVADLTLCIIAYFILLDMGIGEEVLHSTVAQPEMCIGGASSPFMFHFLSRFATSSLFPTFFPPYSVPSFLLLVFFSSSPSS